MIVKMATLAFTFSLIALVGFPAAAQDASNQSADKQPLVVSEIYPSGDVLPENLLRFYVYFSKPMRRDDVLSSIRLLDGNGEVVEGAFFANRFDLWSSDRKRLTLLFDPGRVKTGLVANDTMGRALKANRDYVLMVDTGLLAMDGTKLDSPFRKSFRTVEADFKSPDLDDWKLSKPETGTKEQFIVELNGPHDHVSLAYRVRVKNDKSEIVQGKIDLGDNEQQWMFSPTEAWQPGQYRLVVDSTLEDIAGNRMTGSFERPLSERNEPKTFQQTFTIGVSRDNSPQPQNSKTPGEQATLLKNGKFLTISKTNPTAAWMVIEGARIKAIGSGAAPPDSEHGTVIDLGGRTVIPGLIDSHIHFLRQGQYPGIDARDAETATDVASLLEVLKRKATAAPNGQAITVMGGIVPLQFAENRFPTREELDQASANRVIYLQQNFSGPAQTNSVGVKFFREDQVEVSDRGVIAGGQSTNMAFAALSQKQTEADKNRATLDLMKHANSLGLTMVFDEGGTPFPGAANFTSSYEFLTIQSLWRDNRDKPLPLPLRVRLQFGGFNENVDQSDVEKRLRFNWPGFGDDFLRTIAIGEHVTPFPKDGEVNEAYAEMVELIAKSRWPHEQHSTSFAENQQHLAAIVDAHAMFPIDKLRWTLSHVFELGGNEESMQHVEQLKRLGMAVRVQNHGYTASTATFPLGRVLKGKQSGPLYRTLKDAGVKMGAGTDGPLGFPMNPWLSIYYMTTGRDCTGTLVNEGQTLSRQEALELYTINNAWLSFEEDQLGSLEAGKLADFVVLTDDYLNVKDEELKKLRARMTFVGGTRVYDDGTLDGAE